MNDAALRERAKEAAIKWCQDHAIWSTGTLCTNLAEKIYSFGDAARAEQRKKDAQLIRQMWTPNVGGYPSGDELINAILTQSYEN